MGGNPLVEGLVRDQVAEQGRLLGNDRCNVKMERAGILDAPAPVLRRGALRVAVVGEQCLADRALRCSRSQDASRRSESADEVDIELCAVVDRAHYGSGGE